MTTPSKLSPESPAKEQLGEVAAMVKRLRDYANAMEHPQSRDLLRDAAALIEKLGQPQPVHRECEQCGMMVACWSDAQIEAIERGVAMLRGKIKATTTGAPMTQSDKRQEPSETLRDMVLRLRKLAIADPRILSIAEKIECIAESQAEYEAKNPLQGTVK